MDAALVVIVLGAPVVLALVVGGYLWVRARGPREEPFYHFLCPGCRYRLRYQAQQVGDQGKCLRCGKTLDFPPIEKSIEAETGKA